MDDEPADQSQPSKSVQASNWFLFAFLFEFSLIGVAAMISWIFGVPLITRLYWSTADFFVGVAGTIPLILLFCWMLKTSLKPFVEIRDVLDSKIKPIFSRWTTNQLAQISITAGIGEEILFRSVIQGGLVGQTGSLAAVVIASVLFGLCHAITTIYFVLTTLVGFYLSFLWHLSGNLLAPIVTHAFYDFVALYYYLRVWRD